MHGAQIRALWQAMGWEVGGRFQRVGTYVHWWLIDVDVRQKPTQYCKAIILQLKTNLQRCLCSNAWNLWSWPYRAKRLCSCDGVKDLKMRRLSSVIQAGSIQSERSLYEGWGRQWESEEKTMWWPKQRLEWCTLKMEQGATSQGMQVASGRCEGQGNKFSSAASKPGLLELWNLDFCTPEL